MFDGQYDEQSISQSGCHWYKQNKIIRLNNGFAFAQVEVGSRDYFNLCIGDMSTTKSRKFKS